MAEGEQRYNPSGLDLPGGSTSADIQQQRELFEAQLETQTGDSLLDVWDRYIKWAWKVFPLGGKGSKVNELLERAVIEFANQHKYNNDSRYVNLCIQVAQQSASPGGMYSYMQAEGIGVANADLYLSWAKCLQSQGDHQMALRLVQQGLASNAQPADQLLHYQRVLQQGHQSGSGPAPEEAPEAPLSTSVNRRRRRRDLSTSASHTGVSSRSVSPGRTFQTCDVDSARRATAPEPHSLPQPGKVAKTGNTLAIPTSVPRHLPQASRSESSEMEEQLSVPFTVYEDMQDESTHTQPAGSLEEAGLEERGGDNERPMYCKEQLKGEAAVEFSFEELRSQIYFDGKKRQVEERLAQVEQEKLRLKELLIRRSQQEVTAGPAPLHLSQASRSGSGEMEEQLSVPFTVYEDMQDESTHTQPAGYKQPGAGGASQDGSLHEVRRVQPPQPGAVNSELPMNNKSSPEKTESMSEEMTVYGYQNKTLFSVPDNTCDFAAAAKMASTPCNRAASQRPSRTPNTTASRGGLTEDLTEHRRSQAAASQPPCDETPPPQPDSTPGATQQRLQLSPIHEMSQEGWSSSASAASGPASSLSSSSSTAPTATATRLEESIDHAHSTAVNPCSVDVRKRIVDQSDITSSPNFHSEHTAMPKIQDGQLTLGSQSFYVPVKLCDSASTAVYEAYTTNHDSSDLNVLLKVDSCPVPWDFYMASRLRDRQADEDPRAPPLPDVSCFLFLDGCVTVYKLPPEHILDPEMYQDDDETLVPQLAACVLKLTRSLHASHLLQGRPQPHMLFAVNCVTQNVDCLLPVDLASSLDLLSQQEVTSARQLPHALPYITQGLIRPSDSPYQVDLAIVAETIYTMLTKKHKMDLIQDQRGWTVDGLDPYNIWSEMWAKMFRMLLNPAGQKTSVTVLSELLDLMASAGIEI